MSALIAHSRQATLTASQVESLMERAHSILLLQGIRPRTSPLSYLYGKIHQVLSLIHRREGKLFRSSWDQLLASYISGVEPLGGAGFFSFAYANRSLRLGMAAVAMTQFQEALQHPLKPRQRALAHLGILRCLRLSGDFGRARQFIAESRLTLIHLFRGPELSDIHNEWDWESMCLECCQIRDFRSLIAKVKRGGTHYQASYVIETFFWFLAQGKKIEGRLPKIRSLTKYPHLHVRQLKFWYKAALTLENCMDTDIPLTTRLNNLGRTLSSASRLLNIEQELLLWLAACRWLQRIHSFDLATLCLKRYEALSLQLSQGARGDVLGIAPQG